MEVKEDKEDTKEIIEVVKDYIRIVETLMVKHAIKKIEHAGKLGTLNGLNNVGQEMKKYLKVL